MEQIKQRWNNLLKIYISKDPWTPEEDKLIATIIESMKDGTDWKTIAKELNARNPTKVYRSAKQCRERWNNHIDPCINRGPWIKDHDLKLVTCYLEIGKKWSQIAKGLSNRTENAVKNRWHSLMRRVGLISNGCAEISEADEKEKAKQLLKLIMNGSIYEKGEKAMSGEDQEQMSPQVKKEENNENDMEEDDDSEDEEYGESSANGGKSEEGTANQQSTTESTVNIHTRKSSSDIFNKQLQAKNATSDIDQMLEKIRRGKELSTFQGQPEIKIATHIENPENQLLRNLSYVSNSKPTLQQFGEFTQPGAFFSTGTAMPLEINNITPIVQLNQFGNSVNYQFPSSAQNMHVPYINAHLPFQTTQPVVNMGRSMTQMPTPLPSIANGYHLYGYQQHQMPFSHQIAQTEARPSVAFDLRTGQELQLRSLGELDAGGRNRGGLSPNETRMQPDVNLKVRRFLPNLFTPEGLQLQKNRYQFAIVDKEENGVFFLDPVSANSLNLLKELTKTMNH